MNGKVFKSIIGRIPDDAEVLHLCAKYIAWRVPGHQTTCYSFHPERLDTPVETSKE